MASLVTAKGPNQISRENGKRRVVVQANVRGRDIAGVVQEAQARIASNVRLPAGVWLDWGGQFENLERARSRLAIVVPLCFVLIVTLLYTAVGSWRKTAIIFTGVPLALVGGSLRCGCEGCRCLARSHCRGMYCVSVPPLRNPYTRDCMASVNRPGVLTVLQLRASAFRTESHFGHY